MRCMELTYKVEGVYVFLSKNIWSKELLLWHSFGRQSIRLLVKCFSTKRRHTKVDQCEAIQHE
jgi:hypothetical protein